MAKITYDNYEEFVSDSSEFEMFQTEKEAVDAVEKAKDFSIMENFIKSMKCRRYRPCRIRYCYVSEVTGRLECVTTTTYCCVE